MKHYNLSANETVLHKGTLSIIDEELIGDGTPAKYVLTNIALVLFVEDGGEVKTHIFSLSEVKIYENEPQIIRKDKNVDIYFIGGELYLEFPDKKSSKDFTSAAKKLVGGSPLLRSVTKAKDAVNHAGEAIGINVKSVASVAGNIAIDMATAKLTEGKKEEAKNEEKKPSVAKAAVKTLGVVAKNLISASNKKQ